MPVGLVIRNPSPVQTRYHKLRSTRVHLQQFTTTRVTSRYQLICLVTGSFSLGVLQRPREHTPRSS